MKPHRSGMRGRPGLFMGKRNQIKMRIGYRIWDIGRKIKIKIKMKEPAGYRLQVGPDL